MKLKKLIHYVGFIVICIVLFVLGRSSALSTQSFSHLEQLNVTSPAKVGIIQPNRLNNPNALSNNFDSIPKQSIPLAAAGSTESLKFTCQPRQVDVHNYSGGVISYCKKKDFAIAETDSARVDIKPGAARSPHWHDTWEEQILISGKAKTVLIDNKGQAHEEVLEPGMISFLPAGWPHWSEAIGNDTVSFLFIFPAGYQTFELGDSVVSLNPKVMQSITGSKLPKIAQNRDALVMMSK
ncbi:cupin domain-containing protein [Aerosakkonemataceae cyanobacterium BLCC-F50]|uniref:Cupin domain-containing protein n=1 Tax=Floridaenema flaviceps BLCC-F50 TaxID=3153642 RepID=A0ABV4XVZ6_9CYAN